ncbi:ATP-dependent helicase HrpB [Halomonas sp. Bachu 37]|uniref:ATP-dependent helicase HrpB n=1 Tax=Halomonas kashgarensis TaxID=3084920 RepID=UPI0032179C9D
MSDALPIEARLGAIRQALGEHSRVLLVAQPGAGKTTRVPLALLDEPWCAGGKLLLLEPRRVAARLAAGFMAASLGEEVGETVGYRMRGESRVGPNTRLEVVTQGVLTRLLQDDPLLDGVAGIIFDEFHERSLEADLGLALALDIQQGLRDELRLLVMSATLDTSALLNVLGERTPLIECEGRQFPVTTHYRPLSRSGTRNPSRLADSAMQQAEVVVEAVETGAGDVLVILPGVAEIERLAQALDARMPEVCIQPLHGRLPLARQREALRPAAGRRVVLATAIAESSVTVEGVGAVVDAGLERVPAFQPRNGLSRLETRRVNRASADQRRGRAGRQGPGHCFRLWPQEQPLVAHGEPEIRQADLSSLVFELARWGVNSADALTWMTPPPQGAWQAGRALLMRLGVLDRQGRLTTLGSRCSRWPVSPRLAVMLERAFDFDATPLACQVAALLESREGTRDKDLASALRQRMNEPQRHSQWHAQAWRLARIGGVKLEACGERALGELLALAYPDRVAQCLEPGRFRLAAGGLATLPLDHALAHQDIIVAVELDGDPSQARIFQAVALNEARLRSLYPETRQWQPRLAWSSSQGRLVGEEVQALEAVVLASRPLHTLPPEAVTAALIEALRRRGHLTMDKSARQLLGRVALLRQTLGEDWPDWSMPTLLATLETWLAPYLPGITWLSEVDNLPLATILLDSLEWSRRNELDTLAPSRLAVPSGSVVAVDYQPCNEGGEPVLAVKLQEVFGWRSSPSVVQGRVPILLHLLSPARRPLQVTSDLESFWNSGYPQVRKEMRGRYPKHPWPEDPLTAQATARTRQRSG